MPLAKSLLVLLLFFISLTGFGQAEKLESLKSELDSLSNTSIPQLDKSIDISLTNISLAEFVRTISNHVGLNINIDPSLSLVVNNNYAGVKAKDILWMLCNEYKLQCKIYGNIINLEALPENNSKQEIYYDSESNLLSYELDNASLNSFTKALSDQSNYNFFLLGDAGGIRVNGFVKSLDVMEALKGLGQSHNFTIRQESEKLILIEPLIAEGGKDNVNSFRDSRLDRQVTINSQNQITVTGQNLSCDDLFHIVTNKLDIPFHQKQALGGTKNLSLKNVGFNTFMNSLVAGSPQTYKFQKDILFIGDRAQKEMKTTRVIKFHYRRVDSLLTMLPKTIFPNADLKEFSELNSLIVTADADLLDDVELKLREMDVSVPVVLIDVIILDVGNTEELETGIEAGIVGSEETLEKGGTLNPGIDYTMDASSINKAMSRLGLTKIGKVTPDFYVKLKALETNGVVDIRSTPQLSTLNGHPASMSIGETQYYEEKRNVYQGSLNPQLEALISYLPVEAQLGVIIEPFVTGNGDVTLRIEVEQSNFTDRFKEDAPPGLISRKFKSMIRVKNQEMVLLGGLEELLKEKKRTGLPGIAKVPVLSWFFTKRTSKNNKSRLNIFIKPTILY